MRITRILTALLATAAFATGAAMTTASTASAADHGCEDTNLCFYKTNGNLSSGHSTGELSGPLTEWRFLNQNKGANGVFNASPYIATLHFENGHIECVNRGVAIWSMRSKFGIVDKVKMMETCQQ